MEPAAESERKAEELGEVVRAFGPSMEYVVAGYFFSIAIGGGGLAILTVFVVKIIAAGGHLPATAEKELSWAMVLLGSLIAGVLLICGYGLVVYSRNLLKGGADVCERGLRRKTSKGDVVVLWSEVKCIRESLIFERMPLLRGPANKLVPKMKSAIYTVVTGDKELQFVNGDLNGMKAFAELLRRNAPEQNLVWEVEERHDR